MKTKDLNLKTETFRFKGAAQQDHTIVVTYRDIDGQRSFESIDTLLNMRERQALLRRLNHPGADAATAPYTYLVQNHLASFQSYATLRLQQYQYDPQKSDNLKSLGTQKKIQKILRLQQLMNDLYDLSSSFVPFEQLLNDDGLNPTQTYQQLQQAFATFQHDIQQKLHAFEQHHQHNAVIIDVLKQQLRPMLNEKITLFQAQLDTITQPPSQKDIQALVALQHQPNHLSLGVWMGECLRDLLDMGIKTAKVIQDKRLSELTGLPPGVSELSDAKFSVELKMGIMSAETVDAHAQTSPLLISHFLQNDQILHHLAQFKLQRLMPNTPAPSLEKETIYLLRENDAIHYQFFNAEGLLIAGVISHETLEPTDSKTREQFEQLLLLDSLENDAIKPIFLTLYPEIRRPLNLTPYLENWNMAPLIRLLQLLSDKQGYRVKSDDWFTNTYQFFSQGPPAFIAGGLLLLMVGLAEGLIAITRFSLTLLLFTPLYYLTFRWSVWLTFDKLLSEQHDRLSDALLLKRAKRLWNRLYQSALDPSWQKILTFFNDPISEFQRLLAEPLSLESISHFVDDIGKTFKLFFTRLYQQMVYMRAPPRAQDIFEQVLAQQSTQIKLFNAHEQLLESLKNNPAAETHPDLFPDAILNPRTSLKLPTALISDIVGNNVNHFIIPKFHQLPGLATTYFAVSCGACISYIPSITAIALVKSLATYFSTAPNWVGVQLFSHLPSNVLEQTVSLFMFWRLGMMSGELMVEMYKGHYSYLTTLLDNPEELTIRLTSILGIGFGLQYLPPLPDIDIPLVDGASIPNYFFAVVNWFIDEAVKRPSRIITVNYGLLGLEFAIILNAFSFEDPHHQSIKKSALNAFMQSCIEEDLLAQSEPMITQTFERLCQKHLPDLKTAERQLFLEKILYVKNDPSAHQRIHAMNQVQQAFNQLPTATPPSLSLATVPPTMPSHLSLIQPENTVPIQYPPATKALMEALEILQNPNVDLHLDSNPYKEAYPMYDHLDKLFDQYHIEEQQRAQQENRPAVLLDKKTLLKQFYQQYCDVRSNDLRRTLTILFFYIIPTLPWRGIQWFYARYNQKAALQEKVTQSFRKDRLMLMQIVTNIITAIRGIGLALSSLLRVVVFALPILTLEFANLFRADSNDKNQHLEKNIYSPPQSKITWLDRLYAMANQLALHKIDWVPRWYRSLYASEISQVSEVRPMQQTAKRLFEHLQQQHTPTPLPTSAQDSTHRIGAQLVEAQLNRHLSKHNLSPAITPTASAKKTPSNGVTVDTPTTLDDTSSDSSSDSDVYNP